jgi:predicted amidophosphoribosyltransferase
LTLFFNPYIIRVSKTNGGNKMAVPIIETSLELEVYCGSCNENINHGYNYCPNCGLKIDWDKSTEDKNVKENNL